MLNMTSGFPPFRRGPAANGHGAPSLADLLLVLRHQRRLIAAVTVGFVALATIYVLTAPKLFNATANLLIDIRQEDPLQKERAAGDAQTESTAIESHVQLLMSDAVATSVVRQLGLDKDPEFVEDDSFLPVRLARRAANALVAEDKGPPTPEEIERTAVDHLVDSLSPARVGRTYVVAINYTSLDPQKAARIANAVATAYTDDQLQARLAAADRSASWLKTRAAELRQQSLDADRAVQGYKTANNIVDTPRGFVKEQQLNDMNSQLVLARAQTAEKKARYDRVTRIGPGGIPDSITTDSLQNAVIVRLRQQYLDDARRESELSTRYGESHPAVTALRSEMTEIKKAVRDELGRIAQSYENEYRVARENEEEIERNLGSIIDQTGKTNHERVELKALEGTAQIYRTLFETFLQQYATTLQQQTFPIAYARVITPAKPPTRKTHPRTSLILLGSLIGGLGVGWLAGFARESLHPTLRTEGDIEDVTGLRSIGVLPEIVQRKGNFIGRVRPMHDSTRGPRYVGRAKALLQIARLYPHSRFANTIRSARVAVDLAARSHDVKVVGMLSAHPGEGKTVVAANLAQHLAKCGARTILLDWDFQKPSLSEATPRGSDAGLIEVVLGEARLEDVLVRDEESGLAFLPNSTSRRGSSMAEALTSAALERLLQRLREHFDYVVVDLPCLDSIMDARAASALVDGFVLVCAAERTRSDALARAIDRWDAAGLAPVVGFILNRVKVRPTPGTPQVALRHDPSAPAGRRELIGVQAAG